MREFQRDFRGTEKYNSWYADFYGTGLPSGAAKAAIAEKAANMTPEEKRERYNKYARKWRESNRNIFNAKAARRRAAVRDAIPPWLSDEHHAQIAEIYAEAQRLSEATGTPHEVDHICPLVNDNICGLHVPWNLSVLPMEDNRSKSNNFETDERTSHEASKASEI
ncbi:hypothetical protein [Ruegeria arenilitoris]|uniref:hypothetical protein n=1 Tax=Ruegeria arenilitoris TaxID=1173585 RepID=UPI001479D2DC|nr:hypothetical protein [Ruegeria arenilitoris]